MAENGYRAGLDVLRLVSALVIVVYHFCGELLFFGFFSSRTVTVVSACTEVAIDMFFLLSGTVLALRYGPDAPRPDWRRYAQRRMLAIYPMYWLGFGLLFVYGDLLHGNGSGLPRWRVVFSLLGLDGYLLQFTPTFYKIGEWFLGCLLLLYLLFPLLAGLLRAAKRWPLLWAVPVAVCGAILVWWPGVVARAGYDFDHTVLWRLPMFWLGIALARRPAGRDRAVCCAALACFIIASRTCAELPYPYWYMLWTVLLFLLLADLPCPAALRGPLRWLAGQCYGVFLVHHVLLSTVFVPLLRRSSAALLWPVFAVYVLASFALAWALRQAARPLAAALGRLLGA